MAHIQNVLITGLPVSATGTTDKFDTRQWSSFTVLAPGATGSATYSIIVDVTGVESPGSGDWTPISIDPANGDPYFVNWHGASRWARVRVVGYTSGNPSTDGMQVCGIVSVA